MASVRDICQITAPLGELLVVNRTFIVGEEVGTANAFCRFGDNK